MAEKGVVIEFDFTVLDGTTLLFDTTKRFLKGLDGIKFDVVAEARYLAGKGYADGFAALFESVKTKKTAQKAARDLSRTFADAVTAAVPDAITPAFKNFVKALVEKDVRVVIATRADREAVTPAFGALLGEKVSLYDENSQVYGSPRWDSWRRACTGAGLSRFSTLAVTGSGFGVKSALLAGLGSVAVANERVAYQDFGGADDVLNELSGSSAKKVLDCLK